MFLKDNSIKSNNDSFYSGVHSNSTKIWLKDNLEGLYRNKTKGQSTQC